MINTKPNFYNPNNINLKPNKNITFGSVTKKYYIIPGLDNQKQFEHLGKLIDDTLSNAFFMDTSPESNKILKEHSGLPATIEIKEAKGLKKKTLVKVSVNCKNKFNKLAEKMLENSVRSAFETFEKVRAASYKR